MDAPLKLAVIGLSALIWLCPIWRVPTPSVPPLLWGGSALACLLLLVSRQRRTDELTLPAARYDRPQQLLFYALLAALGGMIIWRSASLANALGACVCLATMACSAALAYHWRKQERAHWIAWGWLVAGLINSVFALLQYFGYTDEPVGTAFGWLRQRNQMATLCNMGLLALLSVSYHGRSQTNLGWRQWLYALCAAVLTITLAATCSRTGFLALLIILVGMGVIACTSAPPTRHWLSVMALGFIVSYTLAAWWLPQLIHSSESIWNRVLGMNVALTDHNALQLQDSRRLLWDNTTTLIAQSPWLGVGWRELAYSLRITDFGSSPRFLEQADHAHNLILQFAVELGLPFTALWCSLLVLWIIRQKPWQSREPHQLLAWGVLAAIGLHSLLEYPLWYAPFQIATGFAVGLVLMDQPDQFATPQPTRILAIAGALLLAFCAYAAFDYHRISQLFLAPDKQSSLYPAHALQYAERSFLFSNQVRFAKLMTTPVDASNAQKIWVLGHQVLHFSPEPRVFQILIKAGEWLAQAGDEQAIQELPQLQRQLRLLESPTANAP